MKDKYCSIRSTPIDLGQRRVGMLYEPSEPVERSRIAVVTNYITLMKGQGQLAKRGYPTLVMPERQHVNDPDEILSDMSDAVDYMKQYPGVKKVVALSWSGGCTHLSAYQNIAENGVQTFQKSDMIIKYSDMGELTPVDGIILLDSNWGNGSMTLLSLDPAVISEKSGKLRNPELDLFNPDNGFSPDGSTYSDEFIRKFQKGQGERMNRLIDYAMERMEMIAAGKGDYEDDEPLIIPGGEQMAPYNKLFPQDIRLLSRTQEAHTLLHADGSETKEVVNSVRLPRGGSNRTGFYNETARVTSVKAFLKTCAVRVNPDFGYTEDTMRGIDWDTSYTCTPGNIKGVACPTLVMGMTGGYEFLVAETLNRNSKSKDKTIAFVEGATHMFTPNKEAESFPGQFGDTVKTMLDYIDKWLAEKGRFVD